jgi:hypothetical protein
MPIVRDSSPLAGRTTPPAGYVPAPVVPAGEFRMPTPPNEGYYPSGILRNPLPAILPAVDQLRQFYGRGIVNRRFWP